MKRRVFLLGVGGAICAAPFEPILSKPKPFVVGYMSEGVTGGSMLRTFRGAMGALGYAEGTDYTIVERAAEGRTERLPGLAADLVAQRVDIIVTASGSPAPVAAKAATRTIPIVMISAQSPVEDGLVESLGQPGGNVTGMLSFGEELAGKRLELAREALPHMRKLLVIWNGHNPANTTQRRFTETAAARLGIALDMRPMNYPDGIDEAFADAAQHGSHAVLPLSDAISGRYAPQIVAAALKYRLPGIHYSRTYINAGGGSLLSYGPDFLEQGKRAAVFVDRIMNGASPATMPVEQPTHFALIINLKAARAFGLTIADSLLGRADELIE